jgi:hypothetical protein
LVPSQIFVVIYDIAPVLHRPRVTGDSYYVQLRQRYGELNVFSCKIIARAPISRAKTPPLIS